MNKTKRFLGLFLIVFMLLAFVPMQALANTTDEIAPADSVTEATDAGEKSTGNVAKVGNTEYATLANAFANANGNTVTLLNDIKVTEVLTVVEGTSATLDLNGYDAVLEGEAYIFVKSNGPSSVGMLTVKDTSENADGRIVGVICVNGTLNLESGTITSAGYGVSGIPATVVLQPDSYANYPELNVTGGTIEFTGDLDKLGDLASFATAIFASGTNGRGSDMNFSEDATVKSTGSCVLQNVKISDHGDVTVTNGTFKCGEGFEIFNIDTTGGAEVAVSGGTFSSAIPEEYCADGFELVENADGTYGVEEAVSYVAEINGTGYATIDEAIAAWTNNATLTLLADVTLSDVVTLKSTEHHILNLGTYTMTAASGKNAFVIKACGTGDSERTAITINADATNPGGINAGSKCVVYYKYADGGISGNDRPIIKINGGVFNGSTSSWGTAGIYTIGTAARKCATLNITGGEFNCSINGSGKSKLIISGGTFNYSVGSQGDSTALRLISGGTFKTFGFMTADTNNTKFWFGTSMANSNVGVYVDDNGYIVVGGPVIKSAGDTFEASSANYSGANSLLQYSSAKTNGLYYTSVEEAFADNNTTNGKVTVYADEIDMSGISYKGTIVVPANSSLTITNAPEGLKLANEAGEKLEVGADGTVFKPVAQIGETKYASAMEALLAAVESGASEVKILANVREAMPTDVELVLNANLTITADSAVEVKFYNQGTAYDFIFDSNNNNTLTIGQNVTFQLEDRVIWAGYYGNDVDIVVDGTLAAYQIWHGADTTVNATGTLKTTGEALVMRRGATLTVNGGKVEANYFNFLAGNIDAKNNATIDCGAFWIANTGNYVGEGNVNVSILNSTLTSSGNFKSSTTHADGVTVAFVGSTIEFKDFDGYGASVLDASTSVAFDNCEVELNAITNNGTISFTNISLTDANIVGTGTAYFYGDIDFSGANNVTCGINGQDFDMTVNKGATLLISRFVLGYNRNIIVEGEIEDAHAFDPTGKTPSLKFNSTSGVSVGGWGTGNLTVKDAYVELDNSSWKGATGTYDWSFTNSYVSAASFTNCNAPSSDSAEWDVTFDDSVLVAKNYIKNGVGTTYNFTNGSVATTGSLRIDGVMNIDATSSVTTTSQQNNKVGVADEHGGINGTVNVDGTLTIGSNAKTQLEMLGGELNVGAGAKVALGNNTLTLDSASKLAIDLTGAQAGEYAGIEGTVTNNGTIEVENGSFIANIVDGKIVLTQAVAQIGNVKYATLSEALEAAKVMTGDVTIEIFDKTTLNSAISGSFDSITFVGKDTDAEIYLDVQGYITATGKNVAFDSLKLSKSEGGYVYDGGFMNLAFGVYSVVSIDYTNCIFLNGACASSGEVTYTGCTFYRSHDRYGLWVYGADKTTVDGCTFADIRGIKFFSEGKLQIGDLIVKNTNFSVADNKPAIVLTSGKSVTLENNTYSSKGVFELDLDGVPNGTAVTSDVPPTCVNDNGACGVLVDGKIYTTVAQAAEAAVSGSNVTLLFDSAETVEFGIGVNLDKNGFEANGVTVAIPVAQIGEVQYSSLQAAIDAAKAGDKVIILVDISGETVSVDKNLTITSNSKVTLNDVSISGASGIELTVSNLAFTGNSWIDAKGAAKLVVSGVDANVKPSNTSATNSRSAFISLGRSEQSILDLVIDNCNIVTGAAGINAVLGWASVDEVSITDSTFGSESSYYNNGDAIKFMAIADGAVIEIKNNTVYSNYNGIVFGQNTTRGNAYTVKVDGNTFIGAADHLWIEVSGSNTCKATIDVTSDNTVNGNPIVPSNIVFHPNLTVFTGYAGIDVEFDANGDIIGGSFAKINEELIADGYEITENDGIFAVVKSPVAEVNGTQYTSFEEALAAANAGDTIVLLADVTVAEGETIAINGFNLDAGSFKLTNNGIIKVSGESTLKLASFEGESIDLLDGAIVKNSIINGHVFVAGKVIFRGDNTVGMIYDYGTLTDYYGTTANMEWSVEEGASLTITDKARYGLGYGDKVTIYGSIEDALTARETLTDGDVAFFTHGLVAQESKGWNCDSYFTVENAYVVIGSNNSFGNKPGNYGGEYTFYFVNSVVDASRITFYEALSKTEFTFENSDVKVGTFMTNDADSVFTLINTKLLSTTLTNGNDEGNYNAGTLILKGSSLTYSAQLKNNGTIELDINSSLTAPSIIGNGKIVIDVTGLGFEPVTVIGADMSGFTGTVEIKGGNAKITMDKNGLVVTKTLSGEGTATNPYEISNAEELFLFAKLVNNGTYVNVYVVLTADIDLDQEAWTSIGTSAHPFTGTFDGQKHTISNLWCADDQNGLFGYTSTGNRGENYGYHTTIKNLTIDGAVVADYAQKHNGAAAVVGCGNMYTTIDSVNVTGEIIVIGARAGAIMGYAYNGAVINNCHVDGINNAESSIKALYWAVGGIGGFLSTTDSSSTVTNCSVKNVTIIAENHYGAAAIAGNTNENDIISNVVAENVIVKGAYGEYYNALISSGTITGNSYAVNSTLIVGGVVVEAPYDVVAKVGNTYYISLEAAFAAANAGGTVVLLDNIALDTTIIVNGTVTLNLNGYSITGTAKHTFEVVEGNLTISGDGTIKNTLESGQARVVHLGYNSEVTINEGVTLTCDLGYGIVLSPKDENDNPGTAVLTVNGGTIKSDYAISGNGAPRGTKTTITINGGEIIGTSVGIYHPEEGTLTINGGTVSCITFGDGSDAICMRSGDLVVAGGTIVGRINVVGDYHTKWSEDAFTSVALNGGDFTNATIAYTNEHGSVVTKADGVELEAPQDYKWNDEGKLVACVYVAQVGETKYESLQEAIDAAQNGDTVVLLNTIVIGKGEEAVIDLKGATVVYETSVANVAMIRNNGTLTIKDSVGDGKLSIKYTGASFGYGVGVYTIVNQGGTLNIEGGTIENLTNVSGSMYDAIDNNSTLGDTVLNISGGVVSCPAYIGIRQFANNTTAKNIVNITGGTVTGGNTSVWVQNPNSYNNNAELNISNGIINGRLLADDSSAFVFAVNGGTFSVPVADKFCQEGYHSHAKANGTFAVEEINLAYTQGVDATCTTAGVQPGTYCADCMVIITLPELIPVKGHSYNAEVTDPTCEEDGYTTHTCTACGHAYTDTVVDATGHAYSGAYIYNGNGAMECTCANGCGSIDSYKVVANVGNNYYETFQAALAAVKSTAGNTVVLLDDVAIASTIDALTGDTLDLNGKTLTVSGNTYFTDGTTTFTNGNIVVSGYATDAFFCAHTAGANIAFENVAITGDNYKTGCAIINANLGSVSLVDSTITVSGDQEGGIFYGGEILLENTKVEATNVLRGMTNSVATLSGSEFTIDGCETGLNNSTVTINNSTVTIKNATKRAVRLHNNTLELTNGSTLIAIGCEEDIVKYNDSSVADVNVSDDSTLYAVDNVTVYVAQIGDTKYETLQAAFNAVQDGETIEIIGTVNEGTVKMPASINNVTVEGGKIVNTSIMAHDGSSISYVGLTFDGVEFDNSRISITGWRSSVTVEDLTVTNCVFKNLYDTTNSSALHINMAETEPVNGLTFTNNVIDGATGGSKSGVYAQVTGDVVFTDNVINNVAFRPYVIQITTDDGIADKFVVTGNTFSGSAAGRAQGLGSNGEGTDTVELVVSGNIFKGITNAQQICYWNFNAETTTAVLSGNYYDVDILANPSKIYFNNAAQNAIDLIDMGVYPYYADEAMTEKVEAPSIMVTYPNGTIEYYEDMLEAVPYTTNCPRLEGAVITLLKDVSGAGMRFMENDMVFDLNGHTYTITAGTGSQGTNTSGFQIRPEVTTNVIFKNGTIKVAQGAPVVWMFNVYATDFVVENVTIDCANMAWGYGENCYVVVSRSGDNVQFIGTTAIENFNSSVAGDMINVGGTMTIGENVKFDGTVELDTGATLTAPAGLNVVAADNAYMVIYANGVYSTMKCVAQIGETKYGSFAEALAAVQSGETIQLLAGEFEFGSVKFPTPLKNVTIKGAENKATVIKNSLLYAADGNTAVYEGITFDGIVFKNSQLVFTGNRNGEVIYKDWTITNCEFNEVTSNSNAAVHFNLASDEKIENFTFTNNVINGVTGGSVSGLRLNYVTGDVVITGNTITGAAWNAIQMINVNADTLTIQGNTLASGADEGILNLYNVNADTLTIKENKFLVKDGQPGIANLTAGDVSKNYWGGAKPANLPNGVTVDNYYTDEALTNLVTINYVAEVGGVKYESFEAALKALTDDATLTLLDNVTISDAWDCRSTGAKITAANVTINGNGKTIKFTGAIIDNNWNTVFRFEEVATVKDLTIDVSEATGVQRIISAKLGGTFDNCTFIGKGDGYGIIFGEGAGTALSNVTVTITNSTFKNFGRGVSDNRNDQDAKAIVVDNCEFENSKVLLGASESITFTNNTVVNGQVDIKSYSNIANVVVEATGNTLEAGKNFITANPANVTAQGEFALPVATANGKYCFSLQEAVNAGGNVVLLDNITTDETVTVSGNVTIDLAGYTITGNAAGDKAYEVIKNNGTLVITNGKIVCVSTSSSTGYAINTITNCGSLTINDATIENVGTGYQIGYAIDNNSTSYDAILVVDGGTVVASGSQYFDGIRLFSNSLTKANSVTVNGGEVSSIWMQNPSDAKDVVGSVVINGGTVDAFYFESSANFEAAITGGYVGKVEKLTDAGERDVVDFISGGAFGMDIAGFIADGYHVIKIGTTYYVDAHTEEILPEVGATCNSTGLTEGKKCSVCGEILVAQETVDALDHTEVVDNAVPATCTETGLTEGKHCSVCNTVLVAQTVVDATGHNPGDVEIANKTDATCTEDGKYDLVVYCSACDTELSTGTITIPATGHAFSEWIFDAENCKVVRTCANDATHIEEKSVVAKNGNEYYETLQDAVNAGGTVVLLKNIALDSSVTVSGTVALNLNGKTITGTDNNVKGNFYLFNVTKGASFTVGGEGEITLTATTERNWNASSVVIANNQGTVTVNGGTIKHLGGTSMAYALDNLTNGKNTIATMVVNGGTIDSTYFAIRQFANSGTNNLTINGGDIGYVWMQSPNANANVANTTVTGGSVDGICLSGANANATLKALATCVGEVYGTAPADHKFAVVDGYHVVVPCEYVAEVNGTKYESFEEAIAAANANGGTVVLLENITLNSTIKVTGNVTLDLNGKTITGTDNSTGSFSLFTNNGEFTVTGDGAITLIANNNRGWNGYSTVISNTVGGKLIVNGGTIKHLGGTDMAYAIDNLTNGKGTYAETVINGGEIISTYSAIRQFLNGTEAQNILTINGGTVKGTKRAIYFQDPSKNANSGTLTIGENASINGTVYLDVTEGSTEWPVTVSVATAALKNGSTVTTENVPSGYHVTDKSGTVVVEACTPVIDAAKDATCTETGLTEGKHCSVCNAVLVAQTEVPATGHTAGEAVKENENAPTCTATGSYDNVTKCTVCGEELSRETVTVPVIDHSYNAEVTDPTCTAKGYTTYTCSVCGDTYVDNYVDMVPHTLKTIPAVNATCTATGLTEGKYCEVCMTITVVPTVTDKVAHKEVEIPPVAPTYENVGYEAGIKCSVCGTIIKAPVEIPALKAVAKVGNNYYATLEAAIAAAGVGDTVELLADVNTSSIITINKAITLNGNGNTITSTAGRAINVSGANGVIIKNVTIEASGERAINVIDGATNVVIYNVDATAANYAVNVAGSAKGAIVTIENSTLTGLNAVNVAAANVNVTINGGEIIVKDNSSVENYAALALHVNANNSVITATNVDFTINGDSTKASNGTNDGKIIIDGIELGGNVAYIQYADGTAYTFKSLEAAFAKAKDGDTIVILSDVTIDELIKIEKKVTLDLGGHKVTSTAKKAFEVYADATIKNGTIVAANRCVDTREAVVLTLDGVKLIANKYTTAYGNPQPLTIGGSENGTVVNMNNVSIDAGTTGYGIITFVKTVLNANDSEISGYSALYVKPGSEGSSFTFTKSVLTGTTGDNDVEGNSFSVIAVRANGTIVNVDKDSAVIANGDYCYAITLGGAVSGEETTTGVSVTVVGAIYGNVITSSDVTNNTVKIPANVADKLSAEYSAIDAGDGLVELVKKTAEESIWKGISVTAGASLDMNFYVDMSKLDANKSYYAKAIKVHTEACDTASVEINIPQSEWVADKHGTKIVVKTIAAREMNCDIQVQIFEVDAENGDKAVSTMTHKSIVDYAMHLINSSDDKDLKTLLVDMLNYGTEAQIYFNHDVSEKANRLLTKEQTELATGTVDPYDTAYLDSVGNHANNLSFTLDDTIDLNLWFSNFGIIENFDKSLLTAKVSYTDFAGYEISYDVANTDIEFRSNDQIAVVKVNTLSSADVNTVVTCELMYNGESITTVYANIAGGCYLAKEGNTPEKAVALQIMKYGQSAYNYFSK